MRIALIIHLTVLGLMALPRLAISQTVGAAAIAQEVHSRLAEQQIPVLPPRVVPPPVVGDAVVPERIPPRVEGGLVPMRVTDQIGPAIARVPPITPERVATVTPVVVTAGVPGWLTTFSTIRYGYYNDGFANDNWFYDYYEIPPAVASEPATSADPGYRTSWHYDPVAEQRLFRW